MKDLDPARNQALIPCNHTDFLMHKRQGKSTEMNGMYTIIYIHLPLHAADSSTSSFDPTITEFGTLSRNHVWKSGSWPGEIA